MSGRAGFVWATKQHFNRYIEDSGIGCELITPHMLAAPFFRPTITCLIVPTGFANPAYSNLLPALRASAPRITRFVDCVPEDWGGGWENVSVGCTAENQRRCAERLSLFLSLPIKNRILVCEPLLEKIDLGVIPKGTLGSVIAGGESGPGARTCDYAWILDLRRQCVENGVRFHFKQTGANFVKEGKRYAIPRKDQIPQAGKACIDYEPEGGNAE